jgi:hypothetical protein
VCAWGDSCQSLVCADTTAHPHRRGVWCCPLPLSVAPALSYLAHAFPPPTAYSCSLPAELDTSPIPP